MFLELCINLPESFDRAWKFKGLRKEGSRRASRKE
jgi:hypothetical protein